jgi:hypothetical protein
LIATQIFAVDENDIRRHNLPASNVDHITLHQVCRINRFPFSITTHTGAERQSFFESCQRVRILDGFSVVALGIALPLLKHDMTITPVLVGLIGSALVLGAVLERRWAGSRRIE